MKDRIESYVEAIVSNPEWIKSVAVKHDAIVTTGSGTGQIACKLTAEQIANAVLELETTLLRKSLALS